MPGKERDGISRGCLRARLVLTFFVSHPPHPPHNCLWVTPVGPDAGGWASVIEMAALALAPWPGIR